MSADNYLGQGTIQITTGNTPIRIALNGMSFLLPSGSTGDTLYNISPTGSWIPLDTGSVSKPRLMIYNNFSGSNGAVVIATNTSSLFAVTTCQPNDIGQIPWANATALYVSASVTGSNLQYFLM